MTAKGYGKDRPIADNKTADGRLHNRRVSLRIVGLQ
jgi:outer membrane protein OmpA-like peptidoglycan-associated protein